MKAVAALEKGKIGIVDIPIPTYDDYECLVRVKACGLCSSTDLKIINNEIANLSVEYPVVIGHEGVGEIIEVGKKVKYRKVGDRIICPLGRINSDSPYHWMWAGMSQYAITHDVKAMEEDSQPVPMGLTDLDYLGKPIPEGMSYVDAVMLLTLKENFSALKNFGLKKGMDILIYGDGAVAHGLCAFSKIMNAGFVGCIGHHDERLQKISKIAKADIIINSKSESPEEKLNGKRFDIIIDAVGSIEIVHQASKMLKPGGKVAVYGVLKKEKANLNLFDIPNNTCIHILNWPYREHRTHDELVKMINDGKIDPKNYYSHVMPMEDAAKGVELIKKREAYKVIFTME